MYPKVTFLSIACFVKYLVQCKFYQSSVFTEAKKEISARICTCLRNKQCIVSVCLLLDDLFFGSVKYSLPYYVHDKSVTGTTRLQGSLVTVDVYRYVHNTLVVYL